MTCPAVFLYGNGDGRACHAISWEQTSTTSDVPGMLRQGIPGQLSVRIANSIILHLQKVGWAPAACRRCTLV